VTCLRTSRDGQFSENRFPRRIRADRGVPVSRRLSRSVCIDAYLRVRTCIKFVRALFCQLGRLVINELFKKHPATSIVATVRNPDKVSDLAKLGVQVHPADYTDPAKLEAAFQEGLTRSC
jgi:hypothetical protein